jgi:protein-S-isoprenylcysteine O-methyltransferase Ste14
VRPWIEWLDLARYALGALLVISLPPAIGYWFIVHPFIDFWRRVGPRRTFWFLGLFMAVSMAALFPFHRALLGRDLGTSLPLILLAVPVLAVASAVSRRRRRYLTFRILAGAPELAPETGGGSGAGLLSEGIYGRIRHPRYVELTLGLLGWSLFINYRGLYVFTALSIAALYLVVLLEERELRKRFGRAYEEYSARVPRFLPRRRAG